MTTLVNLADCREKNQQLATAWGIFIEVVRELRGGGKSVEALAKVASDRAVKLEPRLSTLTIAVAPASAVDGLEVRRGGELIDGSMWNLALPIDGGSYEIVARAPGMVDWSTSITVKDEGDVQTVEVPALAPPQPAEEVIPREVVPPPPEQARAERGAGGRRGRTLAIVALAAGGVAIAGSGYTGLLAFDRWAKAEELCGDDGWCDDDAQTAEANRLADESRSRGWWSTGLAVLGVSAVAVGVWLLVRDDGDGEDRAARSVRVTPAVATDHLGLVVSGAL